MSVMNAAKVKSLSTLARGLFCIRPNIYYTMQQLCYT